MKNIKKYYVDPQQLHSELMSYKDTGSMSDDLGVMFINMCNKILNHHNFAGYSNELKQDMKGHALYLICKYIHNCDPTKRNPRECFNYVTTCIFNGFKQVIKQHYKQENLKRDFIRIMQLMFATEFGVTVREDEFELYK